MPLLTPSNKQLEYTGFKSNVTHIFHIIVKQLAPSLKKLTAYFLISPVFNATPFIDFLYVFQEWFCIANCVGTYFSSRYGCGCT